MREEVDMNISLSLSVKRIVWRETGTSPDYGETVFNTDSGSATIFDPLHLIDVTVCLTDAETRVMGEVYERIMKEGKK